MKKKLVLVSCLLVLLGWPLSGSAASEKAVLYYGNGCPHCANVDAYLAEQPLAMEIEKKEVYQNPGNASAFNADCDRLGIPLMNRGVPLMVVGDSYFIGVGPIIDYLEGVAADGGEQGGEDGGVSDDRTSGNLTLPILIGAALVDSINPCEFAVLFILMSTILASGSKKRALWSGLAYSLSIFISYFLMGLGLYSVVSGAGTSVVFMKVIGWVAIVLGLFNLKDFFWYGRFFVMEVPMSWRPALKRLVRSITGPVSAFLIGFLVSLFLLPCTSGPYIVIIGMLGHGETLIRAVLLLLFYNLIFVLPMLAITCGVYFGLDVEKAEEKRGKNLRILHLIAGIIMVAMGLAIVMGLY